MAIDNPVRLGYIGVLVAILLWRYSCLYRAWSSNFTKKSSAVSAIPLISWIGFVGFVTGVSLVYYGEVVQWESPAAIMLLVLVALTTLSVVSNNFSVHAAANVAVMCSWFPTIHELFIVQAGTVSEHILRPMWIMPVCCNTSLLILPFIKADINVDFIRNKDIAMISICALLLLHCLTAAGFPSSDVENHLFADIKEISLLLFIHGIHAFVCRYMNTDSPTEAGKGHMSDASTAASDVKGKTKPKINAKFEKISSDTLPGDCIEVSVDEAIRLTTHPNLRHRLKPISNTVGDSSDSSDDEVAGSID
jgi:hypothetical protein